uniref:Anaphase promoting complex subunit, putative n=1 Tax=Arundo donax TaxID=35708 RepID=A0A0A8YXJ6_ARUDO
MLLLYCIACLYALSALRNSLSPYKASPCRTRFSTFMDMPASLLAPAEDTRKHPSVWAEPKRPASRSAAMDSRTASILPRRRSGAAAMGNEGI